MSIETINATRWVNSTQEFVEVGTLFRDESLGREYPLIGFNYHPEYLSKYPRLLPSCYEETKHGATIIGGNSNKDMVPSYFKQFLPSERNKSVLNAVSDSFHKLDQFQQIEYLTKFRGVFGSVQLNYDADQQKNRLPKIKEAMALLDSIEKGNYKNVNDEALSAMYHPNSEEHVVSTYIELDGNHVYCTLKKCATEKEANEFLFVQNMMNECGIDSPVTIKLSQGEGSFFVGHITGEQIINKEKNVSIMLNTVPAAVLLADSGYISNFESINFNHINQAIKDSVGEVGAEVFKRALFSHLVGQKDFSAKHFKIKETSDGSWSIAPHEVFKINLDDKVPYKLALTDTISSFTALTVNSALIEMVEEKYKLKKEDISRAIKEIATGLEKMPQTALDSGLKPSDINGLSDHIKKSGVLNYALNKEIGQDIAPQGPDI